MNSMIIDRVALLIPTYPHHYHYIYNLIKKLNDNHIKLDIYLVFSSTSDYDMFDMKADIKPLIMEPFETGSIVTFKKFFGLKQLAHSRYDYIICADSELDIIPGNFTNDNMNAKIEQIFNTKQIYAGDATGVWVTDITRAAAEVFPDKYEYLKKITNDFNLYFWWSDMPVYRRADIVPFLNMVKMDKITNFDYIMYQYYLVLVDDFKLIDTTPITHLKWSLEYLYTDDVNILTKLANIGYGFSWNANNLYKLANTFIDSQNGLFMYNLDRRVE